MEILEYVYDLNKQGLYQGNRTATIISQVNSNVF